MSLNLQSTAAPRRARKIGKCLFNFTERFLKGSHFLVLGSDDSGAPTFFKDGYPRLELTKFELNDSASNARFDQAYRNIDFATVA